MFAPNLGRADRGIRLVGAGTLLSLLFLGPTSAGLLGLYPLITAVLAHDPLFAVLRVDTRFDEPDEHSPRRNPAHSDGPSGGIAMAISTVTGGTRRP